MAAASGRERATLVLFDIDGTLVTPGGAGRRALLAAGTGLFGEAFSLAGLDPSGKLDPAIFDELVALHPQLDLRGRAEAFQHAYLDAMRREVLELRPLPGVPALLRRLARLPGVALGVLTGNVRTVARLKLEAAGLAPAGRDPFLVRVHGDEADDRAALVPLALRRYREVRGGPPAGLLLVGDTPRDVEAGRAHGVPVLAVATGRWPAEALATAGADRVVPDLRDPAPLLQMLGVFGATAGAAGDPAQGVDDPGTR